MKQKWKTIVKWWKTPNKSRDIFIETFIILDLIYNAFVIGRHWDDSSTQETLVLLIPDIVCLLLLIGFVVLKWNEIYKLRMCLKNIREMEEKRNKEVIVAYATAED